MSTIPGKSFAKADQDRQTWQNIIDNAGAGEDIVALTKQLDSYTGFIIPKTRETEYNNATDADKLRFVIVCQKALQRTNNGETTFLTVFEEEYQIEFG